MLYRQNAHKALINAACAILNAAHHVNILKKNIGSLNLFSWHSIDFNDRK